MMPSPLNIIYSYTLQKLLGLIQTPFFYACAEKTNVMGGVDVGSGVKRVCEVVFKNWLVVVVLFMVIKFTTDVEN